MNATMYQPLSYNQMPPFQCAMNEQMILSHQEKSILLCPYMQFVSLSSNHAHTGILQHYRLSMNMHVWSMRSVM